jgi:RNA polymerase sigma factor (TIGR02999 family)
LFERVYRELHDMASAILGRPGGRDTLQPTVLVHEAYMRLANHVEAGWQSQAHFLAVAAKAMRQIMVDHARRRLAFKRGGSWRRVTLDDAAQPGELTEVDLLSLDEALMKLEALDERQCRIVELRFLAGLSVEQTAMVLDVSERTVKLDWRMARAWLNRELRGERRT